MHNAINYTKNNPNQEHQFLYTLDVTVKNMARHTHKKKKYHVAFWIYTDM